MRLNKRLFLLGTRLVALGAGVLLIIVLVCTGPALAFKDVAPSDDYAEAIDELSQLGSSIPGRGTPWGQWQFIPMD